MNVAKATLLLLTLSLLAKQSTALLHPNLRGFSLEVKHREKPRYLLELENEVEKKRQCNLGESQTTIDLLDTVAAPDFEYTEAFGRAIALSDDGSCLVLGHPAAGPAGLRRRYPSKAHVYKRQHGSAWQRTAVVDKKYANHADAFGSSVAVSADCTRIIVGDPCPYHGFQYFQRVAVFDDQNGEVKLTASLTHGMSLANGDQLDLSASLSSGFGTSVLVSGDGGRISTPPAANGGIFDIDLEGNVMPVGNATASALSVDGNRIASTIVDDRGNNEYSVSVRVSDYDAAVDDWISYGNDVFIGMANSPYMPRALIMNGSGSRLFFKVSLAPEEWELFVIDDTGSGFDVVQLLGQIAQQANSDLSSYAFGTDYSGKLLIVEKVLFQQEDAHWTAHPVPGLDGPVGPAAISSDGSILAVRRRDFDLQQDVVNMFGISNGTDPAPEPTAQPTFEPTPNQQGVLVKPSGEIKGPSVPLSWGRGGDPFVPSNYALSANGKCIIAAHRYYHEEGYNTWYAEGRLVVYERTSTSEWLPTFEFTGDNPTGVGHKLAISADCSRIAFSTSDSGDLSVQVYDRSPNNTWEKTIELDRGTTLPSGGEIGSGSLASLAMTEDGAIMILPLSFHTEDLIGKIYVLNVTNDGRVDNVGNVITLPGPVDYPGSPGYFSEGLGVSVSGSQKRFVIDTRIREEQSDTYYDPLFLHYITFDYDHVSEEWVQYDDFVIPSEMWDDEPELSLEMSRAGDRIVFNTEGSENEKPTVLVVDDTENGFAVTSNLLEVALQAGVNMTEVHNSALDRRFTMNGSGDVIAVLSPGTETYMIDNTLQSRGEVFLFRQNRVDGTWDLAAEILPPSGFIFPGCCDRNVISMSRDASVLAVKITDRDEYDRNSGIVLYEISYDGGEPTIEPTPVPTAEPTAEPTPLNPECVPEGESVPVIPGAPPCCESTAPIGCDYPIDGECPVHPCLGATICAQCGNGVCGPGENKCNCPSDCFDEPTPELNVEVKYLHSIVFEGTNDRGFDPFYGILFNTNGSCLVFGRPSKVPGIGGRVYVYQPQPGSAWLLTAELGDNEGVNHTSSGDSLGYNVAVSSDCTRIVAGGTRGIGDRVAIFDLDNKGQWNLKARLWNGTRLTNGDYLELPPSSVARFGSRVAISKDGKRVAVAAWGMNTIYVFDIDFDGNIELVGDPIGAGFVGLSSDGARVVADTTGGIGIFEYNESLGKWAQFGDLLTPNADGNPPLVIDGTADRLAKIEARDKRGLNLTISIYDNTGTGLEFAQDLREVALRDGVSFSNQTYLAYPADIDMADNGKLSVANPIGMGLPVLIFREGAERGSWQLAAQIPPPPGISFTIGGYGIVVSGDGSKMAVLSTQLEDSRGPLISLFSISTDDDDDDKTPCGPNRQKVCIDFSSTDERDLAHGDYVEHDWFGTYGMNLAVSSFNGGYTAQGARVFDTARLRTRDPDLGSPNEQCTPAGPGVGLGGVPGAPGENCVAQGNVLIIQQDNGPDDTEPDDNAYGGTIEFMFDDEGRKVLSIGMLDVDSYASLKIRKNDGSHNEIDVEGLGDNAFQEESIGEEHVSSLEFSIPESGAVSYLCFCDDPSLERIAVELIPSELAIPAPGQEVTFLAKVKHHAGDSDVTITTILETSVGDLNGKGTCSTPQTIAPEGEYSCTFPSSVTGLSGTTVTKIIAATGINNAGIPLLDTATAVVSLIGAAPEPQETCIRFDETPDGTKLIHGDWVKDQWFDKYGMMIIAVSTDGGYTPDGKARIFDTTLYNTQDVDLGSPNQDCVGGGPGIGHGGIRGAPGENCESQGNVVIIQEHPEANEDFETLEPDDNAYGGSLTFTFDQALSKLTRVGLMDIEITEEASYKVTRASGAPIERSITGLGDNSVQEETIDVDDVTSLELTVSNSIGVRYICFQQSDSTSTEQPTLEPTAPSPSCEPTAGPCVSTFADLQDLASRAIPHDVIALCSGEILTESAVVLEQSNLKLCCSGTQDCILKSSGNDRNLLVTGTDFTVQGITFLDGVSDESGGNVKIGAGGDHVVSECEFVGGEARHGGGNLLVENSESVSIKKSSFLKGKAIVGGGMASRNTRVLSIEQSLFQGNNGRTAGGAVSSDHFYLEREYVVSINKTTFVDNRDGAYFVSKSGPMPLEMLFVDSIFESNVGKYAGVADVHEISDLENLDLTMYGNSGSDNIVLGADDPAFDYNCTGFLFVRGGDSLCIGVSEDYP